MPKLVILLIPSLVGCSSSPSAPDLLAADQAGRECSCASERPRELTPLPPSDLTLVDGARREGLTPPVTPTLPSLSFGAGQRVDESGGHAPRIFIEGSELFVFFTAASGGSLLLRRRPVAGGALTATQTVHASGVAVDLVTDPQGLLLIASTAETTRLLRGSAGAWTVEHSYAVSDSFLCTSPPGGVFFRPLQPDTRVALGFSHDTHVFGCVDQGRWANRAGPTWSALQGSFKAFPAGAFRLGTRYVVGSASAVAWSDDGTSYQEVPPDGFGTSGQIRAESMALAPGPSLCGVQLYNWASLDHLDLMRSSDGKTWSRLTLQKLAGQLLSPKVAVDGSGLVVAWQSGGAQHLMHSPDAGVSWSAPATLLGGPVSIAVSGKRAIVAIEVNGEIQLREATW